MYGAKLYWKIWNQDLNTFNLSTSQSFFSIVFEIHIWNHLLSSRLSSIDPLKNFLFAISRRTRSLIPCNDILQRYLMTSPLGPSAGCSSDLCTKGMYHPGLDMASSRLAPIKVTRIRASFKKKHLNDLTFAGIITTLILFKHTFLLYKIHPGRLTWNIIMEVWKIISFINGWFVGSMLIFQGVVVVNWCPEKSFTEIPLRSTSLSLVFFWGGGTDLIRPVGLLEPEKHGGAVVGFPMSFLWIFRMVEWLLSPYCYQVFINGVYMVFIWFFTRWFG